MGLNRSLFQFTGIVCFSLFIAACSSKPVQEPDLPEQVYYEKAQDALDNNLPATAVKHLKDLDNRYPFGEYSTRAELDLIYAEYESSDYVSSHASAERFIKNHPDSDAIDYAYYMRALSTYMGAQSVLGRYFDLEQSERDANEYTQSFNELAELLTRYPNSPYAPDAKIRMRYLRDIVAQHELQVAYYYLKRKAPISALRRSQEVIQHYPSSNSVEEALAITIQSYNDLSQADLADLNLSVLKNNFPKSKYLDEQGKFIPLALPKDADPDFWYWVTFGLID